MVHNSAYPWVGGRAPHPRLVPKVQRVPANSTASEHWWSVEALKCIHTGMSLCSP